MAHEKTSCPLDKDEESVARSFSQRGLLLTPPPTRQQTPAKEQIFALTLSMPASPVTSSKSTAVTPFWKKIPPWGIVLLQALVTVPLYIFSFWLMIEGIKAGGDTLITVIDYLAFRP